MSTMHVPLHPACYKASGASAPALVQIDNTNFSFVVNAYDPTTDEQANVHIPVPFCESATTVPMGHVWRCAETSGAARWDHSADPDQNSTTVSPTTASVNDTAIGTANFANGGALTPAVDPTADRMIHSQINRDANNAGDTLTGDAQHLGAYFTMAAVDSLGFGPEFICYPSGAAGLTPGGTTLSSVYATTNVSYALSFPNGGGYVDYVFTLPQYFTGNLEITTWINPGDTGTTEWRHDLRYVGVGETFDGAITAGSAFTITGGSATTFYQDKQRAAVAGAAAGDMVILRVRRTSGGTSTAAALLLGAHVSYDCGASIGMIPLSPQAMIAPASSPASIVEVTGANFNYYAGRFASGSTTNLCAQSPISGGRWLGGGKIVVYWISSGEGSVQFKALYAICSGVNAAETTTDPSATDPGTVTTASGGAGILNRTVIPMGNPTVTNPCVMLFKIQRQSGDGIPANVDVVNCLVEYIPK